VLVATLRDPFVLAAFPVWLERGAASLALAFGAALLLVTVLGGVPRSRSAHEQGAEAPPEVLLSH
jgi:hypothetical protein